MRYRWLPSGLPTVARLRPTLVQLQLLWRGGGGGRLRQLSRVQPNQAGRL